MRQLNLISLTDFEKLNASELSNVKGGVNDAYTPLLSESEDSQDHDSNNHDHFDDNGGMSHC